MQAAEPVSHDPTFQRAIELLGRRWAACVLRALMGGERRFNRLLDGIPGISDRLLTIRLAELERAGLLVRVVDPGPPCRVSYRLTEAGRALGPVWRAVDAWTGGVEERTA